MTMNGNVSQPDWKYLNNIRDNHGSQKVNLYDNNT